MSERHALGDKDIFNPLIGERHENQQHGKIGF